MQGITIILITLLLSLDYVLLRRLQAYVEQTYPQTWKQLSEPYLGSAKQAVKVNFQAALQSGHLEELNDSRIEKFKKQRRLRFIVMFALVFIQIAWTIKVALQA